MIRYSQPARDDRSVATQSVIVAKLATGCPFLQRHRTMLLMTLEAY